MYSNQLDMQTAILESRLTEAARQLEEVTRERGALRSEVEQLKSGKLNERHFSPAFQKEYEKRGEFQDKYKKEFEMRREFEARYHLVMDRCAVSRVMGHIFSAWYTDNMLLFCFWFQSVEPHRRVFHTGSAINLHYHSLIGLP